MNSSAKNSLRSLDFLPESLGQACVDPERLSLSTEHSSVVPRVKIRSQRKSHFGTDATVEDACCNGRHWVRATDGESRNSLLIHCSFPAVKIANFDNPRRCMTLRGIVRCSTRVSEKFTDKFAVPQRAVN